MINPVNNNLLSLQGLQGEKKTNESRDEKPSFTEFLKDSVGEVNNLQKQADQITTDFALGKINDIHDVTIATEKAQLALNLTLAVQNQIIGAYQEIMRMQI